jgi:His-Xaa-Ser system protein HxsD
MMENGGKNLRLSFETKLYPVESVMGAAYKMLDDLYVHLENGGKATVAVISSRNGDDSGLEMKAETFSEEVLSQALRIKILKATRTTRDQILKIAITYAPFLSQPGQPAAEQAQCGCEEIDAELESILRQLKEEDSEHDFEGDILNILMPWEDKNAGASREGGGERSEAGIENDDCDKV